MAPYWASHRRQVSPTTMGTIMTGSMRMGWRIVCRATRRRSSRASPSPSRNSSADPANDDDPRVLQRRPDPVIEQRLRVVLQTDERMRRPLQVPSLKAEPSAIRSTGRCRAPDDEHDRRQDEQPALAPASVSHTCHAVSLPGAGGALASGLATVALDARSPCRPAPWRPPGSAGSACGTRPA